MKIQPSFALYVFPVLSRPEGSASVDPQSFVELFLQAMTGGKFDHFPLYTAVPTDPAPLSPGSAKPASSPPLSASALASSVPSLFLPSSGNSDLPPPSAAGSASEGTTTPPNPAGQESQARARVEETFNRFPEGPGPRWRLQRTADVLMKQGYIPSLADADQRSQFFALVSQPVTSLGWTPSGGLPDGGTEEDLQAAIDQALDFLAQIVASGQLPPEVFEPYTPEPVGQNPYIVAVQVSLSNINAAIEEVRSAAGGLDPHQEAALQHNFTIMKGAGKSSVNVRIERYMPPAARTTSNPEWWDRYFWYPFGNFLQIT